MLKSSTSLHETVEIDVVIQMEVLLKSILLFLYFQTAFWREEGEFKVENFNVQFFLPGLSVSLKDEMKLNGENKKKRTETTTEVAGKNILKKKLCLKL